MKNFLIIFGAKYLVIVSLILGGIYFLRQPWKKKKEMLMLGISTVILMSILALLGGHFYYNGRPFVVENFTPLIPHAADNGFPSDHVLLAAALAVIFSFYNRRVGMILWVLTLLVGFSRVAAGVHHPLDVFGSIVISLISAAIAYTGIKYFTSQT